MSTDNPEETICNEMRVARVHGQQKYGGDDPLGRDAAKMPYQWLRHIADHLERAKVSGLDTLDQREHFIKAGGLIVSAVWAGDVRQARIDLSPPAPTATAQTPGTGIEQRLREIEARSIEPGCTCRVCSDVRWLITAARDSITLAEENKRLKAANGWLHTRLELERGISADGFKRQFDRANDLQKQLDALAARSTETERGP